MKAPKKNSSRLKLILAVIIGIIAIAYIIVNPPTAKINSIQKQSTHTPYRYNNANEASSSKDSADSDAISLTGKKGRYDEHLIGGSKQ
jgi:hypothetical protein